MKDKYKFFVRHCNFWPDLRQRIFFFFLDLQFMHMVYQKKKTE